MSTNTPTMNDVMFANLEAKKDVQGTKDQARANIPDGYRELAADELIESGDLNWKIDTKEFGRTAEWHVGDNPTNFWLVVSTRK
jgi:hypothetical protein